MASPALERLLAVQDLDSAADRLRHRKETLPEKAELASITERADPRDVLVGARYDALASGAHIATGAQRRRAQLAFHRRDLRTRPGLAGVPRRSKQLAQIRHANRRWRRR